MTLYEVPIKDIIIGERIRKDMGDLKGLAASIEDVGFLQPIGILPDRRLVNGERRIRAAEILGYDVIPAMEIHTLADARDLLVAEHDENVCRMEFTASEKYAYGARLEQVEGPKARERMGEGGKGGLRDPALSQGRVRDIVGESLGMSGRQYERIKDLGATASGKTDDPEDVIAVAQEELAKADRGETQIKTAHEKLRDARGGPPQQKHKGHGTEKKQLRALANIQPMLAGIATTLEAVFEGGFEKSCTPEVAAEYVRQFRADLSRIKAVITTLDAHGKEQ